MTALLSATMNPSPQLPWKHLRALSLALSSWVTLTFSVSAQSIIDFENLASPPPLTDALRIRDASATGLTYEGIVWDDRVMVVGADYRVDPITPGPRFALPHSGQFVINNQNGADAITLATPRILTGAWFSRGEYYGFGAGAEGVRIVALNGTTELGSVTLNIPDVVPGDAEPMTFADTSSFVGLTGITGYRIDRLTSNETAADWAADDFQFAPVPEPATSAIVTGALTGVFALWRRHRRRSRGGQTPPPGR